MFSNFLMTGITPLRTTNEIQQWENRPFTTIWPEDKKEEFKGISSAKITNVIRRKPKRFRTSFTTDQLRLLESTYSRGKYLTAERRKQLAQTTKIGEKHIKVWFQNRRMKEKRESTESSCDSSIENSHQLSPSIAENTVSTPPLNCSDEVKQEDDFQSQYQLPSSTTIYNVPQYSHEYYNQYVPQVAQYANIDTTDMLPTPIPADNDVYPTYYYDNDIYSHTYPSISYQCENTTSMGFDYWYPNNFELPNFDRNQ